MKRLETKENWEARYEKLANADNFRVNIKLVLALDAQLSTSELLRTYNKLKLVEAYAAKLAVGMLKGTLKYPSDDWNIEQWLENEEDEIIDQTNYRLLRQEAQKRSE